MPKDIFLIIWKKKSPKVRTTDFAPQKMPLTKSQITVSKMKFSYWKIISFSRDFLLDKSINFLRTVYFLWKQSTSTEGEILILKNSQGWTYTYLFNKLHS